MSALSSGKIDKYGFLINEEILLYDQRRIIEQYKFTNSLLGKAFEKQIKAIKDQRIKQDVALKPEGNQELKSIERLFPKNMRPNEVEIKNEIDEIKKMRKKYKIKRFKIWSKYIYTWTSTI